MPRISILVIFLFIYGPFIMYADNDGHRISLKVEAASFVDIMNEIEKQTQMIFTYESSLLNDIPPITFQLENESLVNSLNKLTKNLPLVYIINEQFIILKKKPSKITINGFVRDKSSLETLIGVSVFDRNSRRGTVTNNQGFFSLTIENQDIVLETSYVGYLKNIQPILLSQNDTLMEIHLQSGEQLPEVVITAENILQNYLMNTKMGFQKLNQNAIKSIPAMFGEADIIKSLQRLPGVSAGTEGFAGMFVRGGNGDDNLYLIDGNPIYQVNHLGGLISAFNPEAIKDVDFYKSAFPARYGGRLSSVMDVHTKDGHMKEYHGSALIGLTSGNLNFEGPLIKDKTSFNISIRRSWFDVLTAPALAIINKINNSENNKLIARYAFTDLNIKIYHRLNKRSNIYTSLYWGQDLLKGGEEFKHDAIDYSNKEKYMNKIRWGNLVASVGWSYIFNHKLYGNIHTFFTRYKSAFTSDKSETYGMEGSADYTDLFERISSENGINDIGIRSNFDYSPIYNHHIRFGSNYIYHRFRPEYVRTKASSSLQIPHTYNTTEQLFSHEWDMYVEDDWILNPYISMNAGIRFGIFNIQKKTYVGLDPRVSVRISSNERLSYKAAYSRMSQYVHQISESNISLPTDMWFPVSRKLKPLTSDQLTLGTYYNLNNTYLFSLEGYYKWMKNILDYKNGSIFLPSYTDWENKITAGKGWSYGLELTVRKETGKLSGWIGYGLMWANRQFPELNEGKAFPAKYDNRHKVNMVGNYKLNENVEISGSWTYMTGNRITFATDIYQSLSHSGLPTELLFADSSSGSSELDYYSTRNNIRLPAYHRLDLSINIYRQKKKGRLGIWNVSIYNVYSRMNPIAIQKSVREKDSEPIFETVGILPIIPSVSYTYKF